MNRDQMIEVVADALVPLWDQGDIDITVEFGAAIVDALIAAGYVPPDTRAVELHPIELVHELHAALYGDSWARPDTPKAVWDMLLDKVRGLAQGKCWACEQRAGCAPPDELTQSDLGEHAMTDVLQQLDIDRIYARDVTAGDLLLIDNALYGVNWANDEGKLRNGVAIVHWSCAGGELYRAPYERVARLAHFDPVTVRRDGWPIAARPPTEKDRP